MNESPEDIFTKIVLEIFKVSGMLNIEGDMMAEEFGLSSARWKVLGAVAQAEHLLTVSEIARTVGQSRQATQRLVDALKKDSFIGFITNPKHKRAKFVVLTNDGEQIFWKLWHKQIPWAASGANALTQEELLSTFSAMKKLSKYFSS
ncbi:MarR family winged helix-turn-helix transcriptional regulator [Pseudoalteromonas peptidolytica]|uniref:MarR family winged helix-turn-helix transcriptional regulator n=1 Tax=Pseudoalteromonas peptidolytica TaxID=61150 RepID=UPI00298E1CB3|nr:MarR family winged helix-turn-helix transcriptional regulator [Pseudoalteromonas peptidolytica]MDW7548439.1 MarR family winged helix-turn-helix transcriptional regulator [Pseudoalteromonas peptidolytica]